MNQGPDIPISAPGGVLAVLADNVIYLVWLPLLLASRNFADRFNLWAKVPADRLAIMDAASAEVIDRERLPEMRDYIYLAAIASAANIGAAASAPIVAAFHRASLVPVSILMALIGYALGNYLAPIAAHLARMAVGQPA
ncbi:MAG: DUF819 family protein [Woeseiaceae bacterium]|nr:DUF819 family protein [Woeseiaceae bacterium]